MRLRPSALAKRALIFVHRWLGVALSVIFLLWFASGIVMMYWSFPGVSGRDRLAHSPTLDPARIHISADEAYAALHRDQPPAQVELGSYDGRPVYRFGGGGGPRGRAPGGRRGGGGASMVFADDGTLPPPANEAAMDRAASAWAAQPIASAHKTIVDEPDQWTIGMRNRLPLVKYSFADRQQLYVVPGTAEIAQYTTTSSRFWAWLGAIPHWIYFTPLRKHQPEWFRFVVWSSLIGTVASLIGVVVAIWMLSPSKRYRYNGAATSIPYTGWKRWHTVVGLIFGITATTWAFSGLLSMGPFPILDRLAGNTPRRTGERPVERGFNLAATLRGADHFDLAAFAPKDPAAVLRSLESGFQAKQLEYTFVAGEPFYIAYDGAGESRLIPINGHPRRELDSRQLMAVIHNSAGAQVEELRLMGDYDAYYLDRLRQRPLPVILLKTKDEAHTRYYIDVKTGSVAGTYSSRNWINRWLYHGLHSLDFPWLYKYRPLWDIVVLTLMLGGTALCVTSLVLTWQVLERKLRAALKRPAAIATSSQT